MKILTVSNCAPNEDLGSGYVIANYARGLASLGHEITLFGPETYEPFRRVTFATGYKKALGMAYLVGRQLARREYDVVEFYGAEAWLAAALLRTFSKKRCVVVHHSNGIEPYCLSTLRRHLGPLTMQGSRPRWFQLDASPAFRLAFTRVDGIVTVSRFDAEYASASAYQDPSRIVSIENPLPPEYLGRDVEYDRPAVLGFFGSWLLRKGVDVVRTDIARILQEFPDARLRLVGVGHDFRKEEHFPEPLSSRVDVVPFVSGKQKLADEYRSVSILVLPSYYESFGLVAAEAMANGCAVVGTPTGFAASLRDGVEAVLCRDFGSPYLYEGVKRLLEDDGLRRRVAENGYRRVQGLSWPNAVEALERTYLRWIEERRAAARN